MNEGIVKTYIEKSKDRIVPKCKYYDVCGGCNLMHLSYKKQLEYKENKVKDILKRYANYENVNSIIGSNDELNYRNKITLKINKKMGYYKRKSNDIVHNVKLILEMTPPELSADIINKGIVLTGGGALLDGLDKVLEEKLKVPVFIASNPLTCVAEGTGILLENINLIDI